MNFKTGDFAGANVMPRCFSNDSGSLSNGTTLNFCSIEVTYKKISTSANDLPGQSRLPMRKYKDGHSFGLTSSSRIVTSTEWYEVFAFNGFVVVRVVKMVWIELGWFWISHRVMVDRIKVDEDSGSFRYWLSGDNTVGISHSR